MPVRHEGIGAVDELGRFGDLVDAHGRRRRLRRVAERKVGDHAADRPVRLMAVALKKIVLVCENILR